MTDGAPPSPQPQATPRAEPPVLGLSPELAAKQVAPDKACPVCGSWLEKSTASGSTAGLPGVPQPAARCSTCGFNSGPLVSLGTKLTRLLGCFFVCALVVKYGVGIIDTKPLQAILLLLAAPLAPAWALLELRRPGRKIAARIAAQRARWTREKEEHDFKVEPRALLAAAKKDEDCPVCGKAKLEGPGPNFLWSRGNLRCPRCRLDVPLAFTEAGFILSLAVAAGLVIGGALVAKWGLQFQGNEFVYRVLIGFAIAAAGFYLGVLVQGSGDELALKELERAKRRFERRRRGLSVKDDDEEPALWVQENLEAVVVAVILALIIRHFVMEAFVIPTGSMAPTLLGDHFKVQCQNCKYPFSVAKHEGDISRDGERVDVRCPLCGLEGQGRERESDGRDPKDTPNSFVFHYPDVCGGNKILVNKFLFHFQPPERWNVIVFKFPQDPLRKNFIKRLVGLPGETLRIDARGDLWVKARGATEFVLARKPRSVQEALWMPVYDGQYFDPRVPPVGNAAIWKPERDLERWKIERSAAGETFTAKPGAGEASLHYTKEIKDSYGYNPAGHSPRYEVGDVRVRATVYPDKDCKSVRLSTEENYRVLTVDLPVGTGDVAVLASNSIENEILRAKCAPLTPGAANEVALGYADERLTLVVNGEVIFEWDDPQAPGHVTNPGVRLGTVGPGGARFEQVKVDRDLYYTSSGAHDPSSSDLFVPEGCYFVMGDNSPNSQDGRVFGFVKQPHLIGRAFLVFWPLLEVKLIR